MSSRGPQFHNPFAPTNAYDPRMAAFAAMNSTPNPEHNDLVHALLYVGDQIGSLQPRVEMASMPTEDPYKPVVALAAFSYQGPGMYRHYKGDEYEVLGLSVPEKSESTNFFDQVEVIYRHDSGSHCDGHLIDLLRRSVDDFNAWVLDEATRTVKIRRFTKLLS
jgi:hypothetical protein